MQTFVVFYETVLCLANLLPHNLGKFPRKLLGCFKDITVFAEWSILAVSCVSSSNMTDFKNSLTGIICGKYAIKLTLLDNSGYNLLVSHTQNILPTPVCNILLNFYITFKVTVPLYVTAP